MRSVFLDYDTVRNGDDSLDPSPLDRAAGPVRYYGLTEEVEIAERIGAADIVLLNKVRLSRAHLLGARDLKLIALSATGTDNIDLHAAEERGIAVCNVRGYCTTSVAQHVWALILSLTQHLAGWHRLAVDGSWARGEVNEFAHPIHELTGRTLGIIGWGDLGRAVAKPAEAFGMRVIVSNRPGTLPLKGRVSLDELLATADVVSLHCPLTPATRGLIAARELKLMKPGALLINTARGGLVDGAALAQALREGRLKGAGIDVLPEEPPGEGEPLLDPGIPNLIVTPHVAWAAIESRQRCLDEMGANIRDFLDGGRRGRVV
ncbi:MAG TPA: D-2-hydroxyacid dehydrogenase [Steroidobacteraceae bacterium]|jgi:glycerate dehydrogenase|nr:D-2-hydroxyacid dehydrogenase [Steroidobacteraceae bacterium]